MKWQTAAVLVAGAMAPEMGRAQSVGHDFETAAKDIIYIWSAPGRFPSNAWPETAVMFGGTGALMLVDEPLYHWLSTHRKSLPGTVLGLFGQNHPLNFIGRSFVLVPSSLLLYGVGWAFDMPDLRHAGFGCISSNLATTISRTLLSRLVGRLRPQYQKGAFHFETYPIIGSTWEMRSFPSGHASNIMTCVSFWNHRFDLGVAEPALYAVAIGVGWARTQEGAHWPSDTFLGEAYGWAVGRAVADRHVRRLSAESADLVSGGFGIRVRFSF